jgi:type I restriction enzyme S subunit
MVNAQVLKRANIPRSVAPDDLPEEELHWCTATLQEVLARGSRFEASVFDVEGKHAREVLKRCKWPVVRVCGKNGLADAYYPPRFKRIWVEKSNFPIYQPSQITELNPEPSGYLSPLTQTDIDALRVYKGQILLTRSGTVGNVAIVSNTLNNRIFSDDVIRITAKNDTDTGYLYAFLRTRTGRTLIRTNEYGAVVSHIEPEHLENVPVPDPPALLKKRIHDLMIRSYDLRDESNDLLDQAEALLYDVLKLPSIEKLKPYYFDSSINLRNYTVKLSKLEGRLDASYHVPIVDTILQRLRTEAAEITTIGDPRISKRIILPDRFARVYVQEGQGIPFIGGKQVFELDPTNKKYLSLTKHSNRIRKELLVEENMIIITARGTIGRCLLVPKHWHGWAMSDNIIRIEPATDTIAGYTYVFLSTDYGRELIKRFIYGAVVDALETCHISQVAVPLLKDGKVQAEINRLALEANAKRTEAYYAEQNAIRITNKEVIYAT